MKMKQVLVCSVLVVAISVISIVTYHYFSSKKIGYIDIKKVFSAFTLKKELEDKYAMTANYRARIIDSLSGNLRSLSTQLKSDKKNQELLTYFETKREEYFKTKERFEEDNIVLSKKYDGQILEQMTQYVTDFGKKNNYKYIFGADGNGTLMYAEDKENISDAIIIYINNKYKGIE